MKLKLTTIIIFLILITFGCNKANLEIKKPNEIEKNRNELSSEIKNSIEKYNLLYSAHFINLLSKIETTRFTNKSEGYDLNKITALSENVFKNQGIEIDKFRKLDLQNARLGQNSFSVVQQKIISELETKIGNINEPKDAMEISILFRSKIDKSPLNIVEKNQLLAMTEYIFVVAKYFSENLVLNENSNSKNGRINSCRINWRQAFTGGVGSGVVGGVRGAYIGATGGTIGLPGFGTVTGGVGGAVFGFAAGFTSGVVSGVVADLIRTCGRKYEIRVFPPGPHPEQEDGYITSFYCYDVEFAWNQYTDTFYTIHNNCTTFFDLSIMIADHDQFGNYY